MTTIHEDFIEAAELLKRFMSEVANFEKIELAASQMVKTIRNKGKIISCGNGGSMSDAMHFAEEMTGRFRGNRLPLPAVAISDPSHLSCVSNDYGFKYVFSRFVEALGNSQDILLAISTSGNSENILEAVRVAQKKGMFVIALTGNTGGRLKEISDIEIRVPHSKFSDRIQEIHIKIIHALIRSVEVKLHV